MFVYPSEQLFFPKSEPEWHSCSKRTPTGSGICDSRGEKPFAYCSLSLKRKISHVKFTHWPQFRKKYMVDWSEHTIHKSLKWQLRRRQQSDSSTSLCFWNILKIWFKMHCNVVIIYVQYCSNCNFSHEDILHIVTVFKLCFTIFSFQYCYGLHLWVPTGRVTVADKCINKQVYLFTTTL